ncbi:DUF6153 family protein [Streptomyces sp. NPDC050703]|uniref:DUF6153 family protein n=1 Tax=Streptomyces sp. NPDC050703 TaxID=3157218 RepID=UPI0034135F4A
MTSAAQPSRRRPAGHGLLLLGLVVLAGVLAMHGLGPGPGPVPGAAHTSAASGHGTAMTGAAAHEAGGDCAHTDGGAGHVDHADATCAATGIGTSYVPPASAVALRGAPPAAELPALAEGSAESGRAPPDLAELQLLRI